MKKLTLFKTVLAIVILFMVSSCKEELDGAWSPMKWKYENISKGILIDKNNDNIKYQKEIYVTDSGELDIVCQNYKSFWFSQFPDMPLQEIDMHRFSNDFCNLTIMDNILHCEFYNIEALGSEEFNVIVTAGDIFYHFKFEINRN